MIAVPLTLLNLQDDGFHLLLEVIVFNTPFKAVLDTGASKTVFDKATVENYLHRDMVLQHTDMVSTGLGTTSMQSFILNVPDLQIGGLHLKHYEVAVLDLSTINYAYQQLDIEPVIGVIGGDILSAYGGIIDYRKHTLKLRQRRR
ncbi:clan AA aspartic protease [Parapedobacter sp. ISTM3]|uniref:Aspartyl protease n=1 Tax=Parapedobacter luteus TaxID=623280 RepID=A0A1T5AEZ3_9SPHI|nr:retropepsin-like aspartic protease [Parapedobacter sp. ISTM3]MBK1441893.1 clan AA aspartic protease [Parapedobacter sp. ISTM3]SKB33337.1 Aspartyl protease [Parapedobacter luteus]